MSVEKNLNSRIVRVIFQGRIFRRRRKTRRQKFLDFFRSFFQDGLREFQKNLKK